MENHVHFKCLGSTNTHLKQLLETADKPLPPFFTLTAEQQESGRGRQAKTWESQNGKNLLMSVLLYPDCPPQKQFSVCRCVSLAVAEFLKKQLQIENTCIKYPNDIYIADRKVAGILIEHSLRSDRINYSIAGIGLNVNQVVFSEKLPNPTSILLETKQQYQPFFCMEAVVANIKAFSQYSSALLEEEYEKFLYKKNEFSKFLIPQISSVPIEAEIKGVTENGLLHLCDRGNHSYFCGLNEVVFV